MTKDYTQEELAEIGRRALLMRDLKVWGEMRKAAIAETDEITKRIKTKLAQLRDDGQLNTSRSHSTDLISEGELAEALGVERVTVRTWLGKSRSGRGGGSSDAPVDASLLS